jgi:hypothetical protein
MNGLKSWKTKGKNITRQRRLRASAKDHVSRREFLDPALALVGIEQRARA